MDIVTPPPHNQAVATLVEAVNKMNSAISRAVDAGVSIELVRSSRYHDGQGNWGDQLHVAVKNNESRERRMH
jgi:hypothetical protein